MAKEALCRRNASSNIARVGRLDAKIGSEIVRIVKAELIASEDERFASYDDGKLSIAHCSYG